jgi:hypothetical protein
MKAIVVVVGVPLTIPVRGAAAKDTRADVKAQTARRIQIDITENGCEPDKNRREEGRAAPPRRHEEEESDLRQRDRHCRRKNPEGIAPQPRSRLWILP